MFDPLCLLSSSHARSTDARRSAKLRPPHPFRSPLPPPTPIIVRTASFHRLHSTSVMSSPRPTPQRGDSFPKPRSSLETPSGSRSPPSRSPSLRLSQMSSHRQSFSESLRGVPPSPRSQRQPSLSQLYLQELIDNPPARHAADPAFQGRDWRSIQVSELVDKKDMVFVDGSMGIEEATNVSSLSRLILSRRSCSHAVIASDIVLCSGSSHTRPYFSKCGDLDLRLL